MTGHAPLWVLPSRSNTCGSRHGTSFLVTAIGNGLPNAPEMTSKPAFERAHTVSNGFPLNKAHRRQSIENSGLRCSFPYGNPCELSTKSAQMRAEQATEAPKRGFRPVRIALKWVASIHCEIRCKALNRQRLSVFFASGNPLPQRAKRR